MEHYFLLNFIHHICSIYDLKNGTFYSVTYGDIYTFKSVQLLSIQERKCEKLQTIILANKYCFNIFYHL